jgi:outer membrane protein assembly factor BamB/protein-L-isoaspartate O-methyltransferase
VFLSIVAGGYAASADDWPMLGRSASHNAVSPERKSPKFWDPGTLDPKTGAWQKEKSRNIKWQAQLGSQTFGDPVVAGGLIWIGTNNGWGDNVEDASVLACFRESDGRLLYRYVSPRLPGGRKLDFPILGTLSCSPLIDGDRMWFTTNRCEIVCLDIAPLKRGEPQPRPVWTVDMRERFGVVPRPESMALSHLCSIASYQDLIFVITGNGTDETWSSVVAPLAPSVICFKKASGEAVWQDNSPGANILTGQWSSPLAIETGDRAQVVAAQGDGWLRSFEPWTGKLIWKFDINFKSSRLETGGRGTRNDIHATPVFYDGRIYLANGQMAEHGEGPGRLVCIDPTKTGDISSELAVDAEGRQLPEDRVQTVDLAKGQRAIANPNSGLVWEYVAADRNGNGKLEFDEQFHRTKGNVAIKNHLLFVADCSGLTHCLDANSGKVHWTYDTLAAAYASPLIVGDKVYIPDEDGDIAIFRLSADPLIAMLDGVPLAEINMGTGVYCSPVFANGVLFVASRDHLFAIADDGSAATGFWNQWRGPERDNISRDWDLLTEWSAAGPPLVWRTDGIGSGIASVAVAGGTIYTMGSSGEQEHVIALDEHTGNLRWKSPIGPSINDAPLMRWLSQRTPTIDAERLYVSTFAGDLICLQRADGKELWRKNYSRDFGAKPRTWGFVDYPVVEGDHLICTPGGESATVAALNKLTGEVVWKCLVTPPEAGSYAAPLFAWSPSVEFTRQYIAVLKDSLIGVATNDGKLLWHHAAPGLGSITSMTPLLADRTVIVPGGRFAPELVVLEISRDGKQVQKISQARPRVADHFMDSTVRLADYLFTVDQSMLPMCLNWRTGETTWRVRPNGSGKIALTYADQRLYLLHADGTMQLVDASPQAYTQRGEFQLPDHQPAIGATFPVIAGGRMYVRDNEHLLCYDLRADRPYAAPQPRLTKLNLPPSLADKSRTVRPTTPAAPRQPAAIFVPTPYDVIAKMLELADVKPADTVFDLGSGDGRIVIAAAKTYGAKAIGIEHDQALVTESRKKVVDAGLSELAKIEQADFFSRELSEADVVTLYLPTNVMDRLLPQLEKLKPGARVVSHFFKFSDVPSEKSLRIESKDDRDMHDIHLWKAPLGGRK